MHAMSPTRYVSSQATPARFNPPFTVLEDGNRAFAEIQNRGAVGLTLNEESTLAEHAEYIALCSLC